MKRVPRALFWLSLSYVMMVALCVGIWFVLPPFRDAVGVESTCFRTNALLPYIECRGFGGADIVKAILNFPNQMIYLPMLGMYGLSGPHAMHNARVLALGLALWIPPLYLICHLLARRGK